MDRPELITALDPPDSPARVEPARARAAAGRARPAPLAPRSGRASGGAGRGNPHRRRPGGAPGLSSGADALAVFRGDRRRARRGCGHGRGHSGRPHDHLRRRTGSRDRRLRPCVPVRARRLRAGFQHGDLRGAVRRAGCPDAQAAHPGHHRLLRGPLLPARRLGLSGGRTRRRLIWLPDLLGPVVPGAGTGLLAGRCRGHRVPHRDRLRARPPAVRHGAVVGAGDHRQRDRQRDVHGRGQPDRRRAAVALLRVLFHLRPVRPRAGPGAPRSARRARGRPRPRPAPRLARAVPVPDHAPAQPVRRRWWPSARPRGRARRSAPRC